MASLWQKTLFYLGLVDEDEHEVPSPEPEPQSRQSRVRTVDPPGSRTSSRTQAQPPQQRMPEAPVTRPPSTVVGRRVEPPTRHRRRISTNPDHAEAGVLVTGQNPGVEPEPMVTTIDPEPRNTPSVVIAARSFTDAQQLADHIRDGRPVVLDLRGTEPAMVRRLVDFATGLTYALDGRMAKTAQGVILVTPHGHTLEPEEQQRLADLGLYRVTA